MLSHSHVYFLYQRICARAVFQQRRNYLSFPQRASLSHSFFTMRGIYLFADGAMSATLMVPGGVAGGSAEEEETMSLEGKVEAFKSDPQLMEAASRFVAEVLEKAKEEAARRSQQNKV